jgi:hypothetical protein
MRDQNDDEAALVPSRRPPGIEAFLTNPQDGLREPPPPPARRRHVI